MNKTFLIAFLLIFTVSTACAQRNQRNRNEQQHTISLTKAEFLERVMNFEKNPDEWIHLGDKPSIITFSATWCAPCRRLAPILNELAEQYAGQIYIYVIDVDREPALSSAFGVRSLPTLLFVPMDGLPQLAQGMLSREALVRVIEEVLLKKTPNP